MVVFTRDPGLSFIVLGLVLGIISGLAFFMIVVMDWDIGPVEVISLVVFVGYSVTYALHIAHNYSEVEEDDPDVQMGLASRGYASCDSPAAGETKVTASKAVSRRCCCLPRSESEKYRRRRTDAIRRERTRLAMMNIGGATLSSAASTMGSSTFLLLCTLTIFVKLGIVVIAVTILSITFALVALPAALVVLGPDSEPFVLRTARRVSAWFCPLGKLPAVSDNSHAAVPNETNGQERKVLVAGYPC
eukprot:gnl/TRDRNA2_/TRDRNA2_118505_c0_seq1.p1 gnl/TRDRNA2_/TRDRNA2_118505_c0~~gnl/TRDRNA2_/TRDRNA2_118505_c0_seq1.p1  ORF type:complete len:253 (+),score=32.33 gnl/TRDRNA2_/TRDRNA2_118505_c0_seq1:24-761(+)